MSRFGPRVPEAPGFIGNLERPKKSTVQSRDHQLPAWGTPGSLRQRPHLLTFYLWALEVQTMHTVDYEPFHTHTCPSTLLVTYKYSVDDHRVGARS